MTLLRIETLCAAFYKGVGAAIAQLAMGDKDATQESDDVFFCQRLTVGAVKELARHVGGAPCVAHAAAVASSALGSLLKGRTEEAGVMS